MDRELKTAYCYNIGFFESIFLLILYFYGVKKVYYTHRKKIPLIDLILSKIYLSEYINFSQHPKGYFSSERLCLKITELISSNLSNWPWTKTAGLMELEEDYGLKVSVKKSVAAYVNTYCKAITLCDHIPERIDYFVTICPVREVHEHVVVKIPFLTAGYIISCITSVVRGLALWAINITGCFDKEIGTVRHKFVVDIHYPFWMGNLELRALFNYLKDEDVVYICPSGHSNGYTVLRQLGKDVATRSCWINRKNVVIVLKKAVWFLTVTFWGLIERRQLYFFEIMSNLFLRISIYRFFIEKYRPKYLIGIRSSYQRHHPVVTSLCNVFRCRHIGYQEGSFCYLSSGYAHIYYNHYGTLGSNLQNGLYKGYWDNRTKFHLLGPLMTDLNDKSKKNSRQIEDKVRVLVFPTSSSDDMWISKEAVLRFYNMIFEVLWEYKDAKIVIKQKENQLSDPDIGGPLKKYLNEEDRVRVLSFEGQERFASGPEIFEDGDLVIVMGESTVIYESTSMGLKSIAVLQEWEEHTFDNYNSRIVCRNKEQLRQAFNWLLEVSDEDYKREIEPIVLDYSKWADGNLVRSFFESIEKDI